MPPRSAVVRVIAEAGQKKNRKRVVSPANLAATLYNNLALLDRQEADELASRSPEAIKAKFEARRVIMLGAVAPEVTELVKKMRGK